MKKKVIIIGIVAVVVIAAAVFYLGINNKGSNKQDGSFEFSVNGIQDVKLKTGIVIEKGYVEQIDDHYRMFLRSVNNTKETVDMSNYRIAFLDENNEEIEALQGTIIGTLKPGESSESVIESYHNLSKLRTIKYEEMTNEKK